MRKCVLIIIILIAIFTGLRAYSEEITVKTEEGDKIIVVPENYAELRQAYIDMALLYMGEERDHRKSLEEIDRLLKLIDEYKENEEEYEKVIELKDQLIAELQKKTIYRSGFIAGCDVDFPIFIDWDFQFKVGYRGIILNTFVFDIIMNYPPIGIGLMFGILL